MGKAGRLSACAALLAVVATGALPAAATNIGSQGCTPGYWKNHTSSWEEYRPGSLLRNNFAIPNGLAAFRQDTFLDALRYGGGSGVDGGARVLFRATVAAYLNAAHEGVGYPYRRFREPGDLRRQVNSALATMNRTTMLALAARLDAKNNLGCPL